MKISKIPYFLIVLILFVVCTPVLAQQKDSNLHKLDTLIKIKKSATTTFPDSIHKFKIKDSLPVKIPRKIKRIYDTLRNENDSLRPGNLNLHDSLRSDSLQLIAQRNSFKKDSMLPTLLQRNIIDKLLINNRFINSRDKPVYYIEEVRTIAGKEFLFYSLCVIVLILGIFKTIFSGYFSNLFRVFFNTSLRQTQLTDQLLQAKLPSFILNIFFTITAGVYIWLLFTHFNPPRSISTRLLLPFCILSVAAIYFIKYCLLKFTGWVSDIQQTTDNYIFVIFLVNKITGILLVPFIILLSFPLAHWVSSIATISVLLLALFFLSRYIKSYGLIDKKMPLNQFHFIIYILGAEIIPLLILYKVAADYLI